MADRNPTPSAKIPPPARVAWKSALRPGRVLALAAAAGRVLALAAALALALPPGAARAEGALAGLFAGGAPTLILYAEFDRDPLLPGGEAVLVVRGEVPAGWHLYSVEPQGEHGPIPTALELPHPDLSPNGPPRESGPNEEFDQALGLTLRTHRGAFELRQPVAVSATAAAGDREVEGALRFQICDNNVCVPPQTQTFRAVFRVAPPPAKGP